MFDYLIEKAERLAKDCKSNRFKHVAFVFHNKTPIAHATNIPKTHPLLKIYPYKKYSETIHAELAVSIKIGKMDYSKLTLVVIRIMKKGGIGNSRPCEGCQFLIKQLGYRSVWYSTNNNTFEKL